MSPDAGSEAAAFGRRLLAERTRQLAGRGRARDGVDGAAAAGPDRLVCAAGPLLVALAAGMVAEVRVAACHPIPLILPAASHAMLGVFSHRGLPYSLIELARLLRPVPDSVPEPGAPAGIGGLMLLLRRAGRRRVALRVDEVLGQPALRGVGDGRHALLPDDRLAVLLDDAAVRAALDALDDPAPRT